MTPLSPLPSSLTHFLPLPALPFPPIQELLDEKSEWDHTLEKIKLLQKLVPDRPIPMEIFDSDVHLVKQGWRGFIVKLSLQAIKLNSEELVSQIALYQAILPT